MKIRSISELRSEYLADEEGNIISRSNSNIYKSLDKDQLENLRLSMLVRQKILEGYAAKSGQILDPIWSQYSYEEILQMEENGVLVPKEVSEMAHALQDNDATYYEIAMNDAEQEQSVEDENAIQQEDNTATKKASFFELVGKTTAKISQSEEKQEQISQSIRELTPTANELDDKKHLFKKLQKDALERLKEIVDEWKTLKDKVKNGEKLSASEQKRYEQLGKMFDEESQNSKVDQNSAKSDMKEIEKSLREIDALAQKGEQIGSETKDAGFELTEFVCKDNYKATRRTISQDVGMIGAMIAMAKGKRISSDAILVGTETEVVSNDTQITLNEIATVLDISKPLSMAEAKNTDEQNQNANADTQQGQTDEIQDTTTEDNNKVEAQKTNGQKQEVKLGTLISYSQSAASISADGSASGASGDASPTPGETQNNNTRSKGSKSDKKDEDEPNINKDNAKSAAKSGQKSVDGIKKDTKAGDKESQDIKKDEEKDEKELEKQEKVLMKKIKKDIKQMNRISKESEKTEKQTEQLIIQYEELNTQNDELIEEAKAQQENPKQQVQNNAQKNNAQGSQVGASASFGVQPQNNSIDEKVAKVEANNQNITAINAQFQINNRKTNKNRTTVNKLGKSIKTTNKKFQKTTKLKDKKAKERVKAEEAKQAKLQKQTAIIGLFENIFGITTAIGTAMMAFGFTSGAGAILVDIGTYGTLACGVTKASIYAANGNLTAALMTLGTTIISAATAMTGTSGAAENALGRVTATLQVVSSAAKVGSSIREVQGKDPGMLLGSISAVAGAASALTGGIQNISNLGNAGSGVAQLSQIAATSGSIIGSASEMISTGRKWAGKDGDTALTKILGFIGTGLATAGALGQLGTKISDKRQAKKAEKAQNQAKTDEKADAQKKDAVDNTTELDGLKAAKENSAQPNSEPKETPKQDNKQLEPKAEQAKVENQNKVQNAELAEIKSQQQEQTPKKTNIVTSRSGDAPISTDADPYAGFNQNPNTNIVESHSSTANSNPSADGGLHGSLSDGMKDPTIVTSKSSTDNANNTELKPSNPEALTGELQGPSDAPIKEAAKGADINKLNADAKEQMNSQFSNETKRPKLKFEDVAKGIGGALSLASQLMPQEKEASEETKAKNPYYVKKSQKNMRYFRKIQKENEAQRVAFANVAAKNGGSGYNQKRR